MGILAVVILLVAQVRFLFFLAGDAQVHLAVAESFVNGHPFQYNPGDPALRAKMGAAGRQRFDSYYTHEHYGRRMIGVFQRLTALRTGPCAP